MHLYGKARKEPESFVGAWKECSHLGVKKCNRPKTEEKNAIVIRARKENFN